MLCIKCKHDTKVADSRPQKDTIRRTRVCLACKNKFRTIEILEGEGWQLQRDNELPLELKTGDIIFIPEYQIHRVIKGNTNLKIQITK